MVGAGHKGDPFAAELRRTVTRLGLDDHVRFVGTRPHGELRPWFCAADLFVLLTKSEGWPNVILESLACGLPVVATRVGGVPEIARDGVDGLLVPYADPPAFRDAVLKGLAADWDRDRIVGYAQSLNWTEVVDRAFGELTAATKGSRRHV
jgi:glycosyltransferase involved in cell wall biosynthesis